MIKYCSFGTHASELSRVEICPAPVCRRLLRQHASFGAVFETCSWIYDIDPLPDEPKRTRAGLQVESKNDNFLGGTC